MSEHYYGIKGLKTWATDDGGGYQCSVYRNGVKVAYIHNDGNGGPLDVDWASPEERDLFREERVIGKIEDPSTDHPEINDEIALAILVDEKTTLALLKRYCAKETVFTVEGDNPGAYRTFTVPFDPAKADRYHDTINKRYPGKTHTIFNELLPDMLADQERALKKPANGPRLG